MTSLQASTAIMRLLRGDRTSSHSVISEPTEFLFVWCPPFADPQVRSLNKAHVSISKSIEIQALKNGVINIKGLRSRFSEAAEKKRKRRMSKSYLLQALYGSLHAENMA